jgi:hypothetical protein
MLYKFLRWHHGEVRRHCYDGLHNAISRHCDRSGPVLQETCPQQTCDRMNFRPDPYECCTWAICGNGEGLSIFTQLTQIARSMSRKGMVTYDGTMIEHIGAASIVYCLPGYLM